MTLTKWFCNPATTIKENKREYYDALMLLIQYIPVIIIEVHTHKLLLALSSNGAWTKEPGPTCIWQGVVSSYSNDRKVTLGLKKISFISWKTN